MNEEEVSEEPRLMQDVGMTNDIAIRGAVTQEKSIYELKRVTSLKKNTFDVEDKSSLSNGSKYLKIRPFGSESWRRMDKSRAIYYDGSDKPLLVEECKNETRDSHFLRIVHSVMPLCDGQTSTKQIKRGKHIFDLYPVAEEEKPNSSYCIHEYCFTYTIHNFKNPAEGQVWTVAVGEANRMTRERAGWHLDITSELTGERVAYAKMHGRYYTITIAKGVDPVHVISSIVIALGHTLEGRLRRDFFSESEAFSNDLILSLSLSLSHFVHLVFFSL
jgi:hypothetical protein